LHQLTERIGLSTYLGLLRDERVTVVEVAESPGSPYLEDFEVGLDISAHATALGKALLTALPPRTRRDLLLGHGLRRFRANTQTDLDRLEDDLRSVRPGAPIVEHGEFRDGVACAAALVPPTRAGEPTWAVVVAMRDEDVPSHICREVALAAADLGRSAHTRPDRALAHPPAPPQ
jgi:DNA-binding IclR family transcriptional regulator